VSDARRGEAGEPRLLLAVFKPLSWLRDRAPGLSRVNWRDMGPEELGSVYESLLELVPQWCQGARSFAFATGGETKGNARKTSGSYYTPDSLVQVLLDSALEPVVARDPRREPRTTRAVAAPAARTSPSSIRPAAPGTSCSPRRAASPRTSRASRRTARRRPSIATRCARWWGAASTAWISTRWRSSCAR
jgi:hypothetical protein